MKPQSQSVGGPMELKPRKERRRRGFKNYTKEDLKAAIKLVVNDHWSQHQAAKLKGIPHKTLYRHLRKLKDGCTFEEVFIYSHRGVRTILPAELEQSFVNYIQYRAKIGRGLTTLGVREVAYRIAHSNNIENLPPSWKGNKAAGNEWFFGFRDRHPSINLRQVGHPICGLDPAMSFDNYILNGFFDELESVYEKYPSIVERVRIYNLDETALMTVQRPGNAVARRKSQKRNDMTNQHCTALVTACCIIRADGTFLPPAMVYPRKKCVPKHIEFAPANTLGLASFTGQMTTKLFLNVMQHFVIHSNSSMEDPTLLIYDNDESHLATEAVNFARENGVILVKLPPHCTDNLQPLTVGSFAALEKSYNSAIDDHLLQNPGNPIFIDDVGGIFNRAFLEAMTPSNITAGFKETGIYEFNRDVFTGKDFSKSYVRDEPEGSTFSTPTLSSVSAVVTRFETEEEENTTSISSNEPEMILGYP